jgi:hypothetical protein
VTDVITEAPVADPPEIHESNRARDEQGRFSKAAEPAVEVQPEAEAAPEQQPEPAAPLDDFEEIEYGEGQKYAVPKALKGAFLMQADYTRKTQELAEQRRTFAREQQEAAERARISHGTWPSKWRCTPSTGSYSSFRTSTGINSFRKIPLRPTGNGCSSSP